MKTLRTPESRFENLPDYEFKPNYVDIDGLRMHYVDEGAEDGGVVLLLHGEPRLASAGRTSQRRRATIATRVTLPG